MRYGVWITMSRAMRGEIEKERRVRLSEQYVCSAGLAWSRLSGQYVLALCDSVGLKSEGGKKQSA